MFDFKIISICVACCFCILVIVTIVVQLNIRADESCSSEQFHDLPNEFWVEEQYLSNRARSRIYNAKKEEIGSYTTMPNIGTTQYRYHDLNDNVVGMVQRKALTLTPQFDITRCQPTDGSKYFLDQYFFTIGEYKYDLSKDGVKIAEPTEPTWFTCKPDITLAVPSTNEGDLIATIDRSCGESWFLDKWHIKNVKPDVVENYVLGFIAYITTQLENDANSNNNANSNKRIEETETILVLRNNM